MLIARLQFGIYFVIQLEESSDIANCSTFLVYVKYVWQNDMLEDLLCCLTVTSYTTGAEVFAAFEECNVGQRKFFWGQSSNGITSDEAANTIGKNSDVITRFLHAADNNAV